jgi:type IV pilus assembly protein PilQ
VPPAYPEFLRLDEIRVSTANGQKGISFRFSRPPEGTDYFPLRNPSRLVIDVKGPMEALPKVRTYKANDPLVSGVRIGNYQGRLRLVVDLTTTEVPQFSVDNSETLVTAWIGEKNGSIYAAQTSQVLFISDEARNDLLTHASPATKKMASSPVVQVTPVTTTAPNPRPDNGIPTSVPVEKMPPPVKVSASHATVSEQSSSPAESEENPPEEVISSKSLNQPNPTKPITVAQASLADQAATGDSVEETPEEVISPAPRPASHRAGPSTRKNVNEEALSPPSALAENGGATGEFKPPVGQEYTGQRISLDFKNADVHDVLRILADVSGQNIVATDDVKARVTLRLVEIPWDQALDVVLQANGLEKAQVGNVITISTTRRLEVERNARLAAQNAQQKLAALETEYVRVNYVKATDVVALITRDVQQRIASTAGTTGGSAPAPSRTAASGATSSSRGGSQVALMSPRGTIAADPTTNVVIIRDVRQNISAIRELIAQVDVQTPQVIIESYIVTANENLIRDLGIQWGYRYIASPETGNPTGVNFPGRIGLGGSGLGQGATGLPFVADFPASAAPGAGSALDLVLGSLDGSQTLDLRLSALEIQGKARVISRPRVVTLNNKVANIQSRRVVRVPVVSGNVVVGGAGTTGGGDAFEEFDVGISLKVTPQISSDGFVLLDIDAESSELADSSVRPSGVSSSFPLIPDELKRTASSNVLIKAGETFVLGGILQDNLQQRERGVPYLRDTPGLGWLFRGRSNTKTKEELLVFITPRLGVGAPVAGLPSAQQLWENRPREAAPPTEVVQ